MTPATKRHHHQEWMPSIFNDFLGNEWLENITNRVNSLPAMNIVETDNEYKIELAVPGLGKDDFQVHVNSDNELVVAVEKKTEKEEKEKKEKYLRREFGYTQFKQTMLLPDNIDKDHIEAKHTHGVLTIEVKKKSQEEAQKETKPIEVK
jgi:HSP20 family protein